jgi:hypothetical protein
MTIEPVHHKGVKIALEVFAIWKTENALCEAGLPPLTEMWELNATMVATTRILANRDHLIRHFFMDSRIQGEYAMKAGTPQLKVEITPAHT